jgi:hypothetical protein
MPRTSRTVAQRLAAQSKTRKRRPQRNAAVSPSPVVERILDEVAPEERGVSATGEASAIARPAPMAAPAKAAPMRRRYADYAAEYAYVWGDLRRIVVVAGGLLLLLLLLSFVIR